MSKRAKDYYESFKNRQTVAARDSLEETIEENSIFDILVEIAERESSLKRKELTASILACLSYIIILWYLALIIKVYLT